MGDWWPPIDGGTFTVIFYLFHIGAVDLLRPSGPEEEKKASMVMLMRLMKQEVMAEMMFNFSA